MTPVCKYLRAFGVLVLSSCWLGVIANDVPAMDRLLVCVSIPPQKFFVEKIGGDRVNVSVMVPPGASPATYEPKPAQMQQLKRSRIYFTIGVPFEQRWIETFQRCSPVMHVAKTQEGIPTISMSTGHGHDTDIHRLKVPDESHSAGEPGRPDPHIWLSPPLVLVQTNNIHRALVAADPQNRSVYDTNLNVFHKEIVILDTDIRKIFPDDCIGMAFLVFHPSWGYFAQAYGLRQFTIEVEGKPPGPKRLKHLIDHAVAKEIKTVVVQPQIASKHAQAIADAIGGNVIIADPLAQNWSANLRKVAAQFKQIVR